MVSNKQGAFDNTSQVAVVCLTVTVKNKPKVHLTVTVKRQITLDSSSQTTQARLTVGVKEQGLV